jgi:hypothetical protein
MERYPGKRSAPLLIGLIMLVLIVGFANGQNVTTDEKQGDTAGQQDGQVPPLNWAIAIGSAAVGVFLSFIIPTLTQYQKQLSGKLPITNKDRVAAFSNASKLYIVTAVQSFLIAVVVIAIMLSQETIIHYWYEALVAGFTFDSTIQKVK